MELWRFQVDGVWLSPNFKRPKRRNYASDRQSFRGARTCSRSSITTPTLVGLGFHPPPGWPKTLRFFVCLSVCLTATQLNAKVQKRQKSGFFSPLEGDRINRSRRNVARKRIPWVCNSTPSVKGGLYRSAKKSKFAKNCGV